MKLKFSVVGVIAFLLLGACVYLWGPGFGGYLRTASTLLLYVIIFGACFVVIRK